MNSDKRYMGMYRWMVINKSCEAFGSCLVSDQRSGKEISGLTYVSLSVYIA